MKGDRCKEAREKKRKKNTRGSKKGKETPRQRGERENSI